MKASCAAMALRCILWLLGLACAGAVAPSLRDDTCASVAEEKQHDFDFACAFARAFPDCL